MGGMLHYSLDGRDHPSPLLRDRGRYFALVQPLRPLKRVDLTCLLYLEDGGRARVPDSGCYTFRVGIPGLRHRD